MAPRKQLRCHCLPANLGTSIVVRLCRDLGIYAFVWIQRPWCYVLITGAGLLLLGLGIATGFESWPRKRAPACCRSQEVQFEQGKKFQYGTHGPHAEARCCWTATHGVRPCRPGAGVRSGGRFLCMAPLPAYRAMTQQIDAALEAISRFWCVNQPNFIEPNRSASSSRIGRKEVPTGKGKKVKIKIRSRYTEPNTGTTRLLPPTTLSLAPQARKKASHPPSHRSRLYTFDVTTRKRVTFSTHRNPYRIVDAGLPWISTLRNKSEVFHS